MPCEHHKQGQQHTATIKVTLIQQCYLSATSGIIQDARNSAPAMRLMSGSLCSTAPGNQTNWDCRFFNGAFLHDGTWARPGELTTKQSRSRAQLLLGGLGLILRVTLRHSNFATAWGTTSGGHCSASPPCCTPMGCAMLFLHGCYWGWRVRVTTFPHSAYRFALLAVYVCMLAAKNMPDLLTSARRLLPDRGSCTGCYHVCVHALAARA